MSGSRIEGMDEAIKEINRQIGAVKKGAAAGFWEAGLKILASAQRKLADSVITGNLRASGYVRSNANTERPMPDALSVENDPVPTDALPEVGVEVGFTALYAVYAHENMEGRSPKFLERTVMENKDRIPAIVKARAEQEANR